jgi:predicted transcriptional regulator
LCLTMRRSKLEMYVDVLNVLAQKEPLKPTHIMYQANFNPNTLKESIDFLTKQGLIEEKPVGKSSIFFTITARGTSVLKFFKETNKMLTAIEEDAKISPV